MALRVCDAQVVWNLLNGFLNVYKPPGTKVLYVRNAILANLCKDLNQLKVREPRQILTKENTETGNVVMRKIMDLTDHELVVGPRYQMCDIKCASAAPMGFNMSGVLVLGINQGLRKTAKFHQNRPIRVFHVSGVFGRATESNFRGSRMIAKANYNHISEARISNLVASLQASHQKKMFELCGVDLQSQAAYEIASKGVIRPANNKLPVIFGMKLVDFRRPEFTLEIHSVNEDEDYLAKLIYEIALELRSVAFCSSIRCIRHGPFVVDDSLLRRHWDLQGVISNLNVCNKILLKHPQILNQKNIELMPLEEKVDIN